VVFGSPPPPQPLKHAACWEGPLEEPNPSFDSSLDGLATLLQNESKSEQKKEKKEGVVQRIRREV